MIKKAKPLNIGNAAIQPGEHITLGLPTPELSSYISMHVPIHVVHGKKEGPILLVSGALHGDEMNGIDIIHNLLKSKSIKGLRGTLIAIPAINVFGLMTLSRNLPDRRDLEGSFPGVESGSFAGRLAHYFSKEIFSLATHCIDIHTAGAYQFSIPQVRTDLDNAEAVAMAKAFQPYVVEDDKTDKGLLWQNREGIPTISYEAGEPLRMDERSIRTGFRGILRVMRHLEMVKISSNSLFKPVMVRESHQIFSPGAGLCHFTKKVGSTVKQNERVARISDPFGTAREFEILSPVTGVITTKNTLALVNEGDEIMKIAPTSRSVNEGEWPDE